MKRAILILLISAAGLSGCSRERQEVARAPQVIRNVAVLDIHKRSVPDVLEAVGTVRAGETSVLASQMMGIIREVRVHEGDRVQRGQVLAVIDESQPRSALDRAVAVDNASAQQLAAAESDLTLAQSTLQRYRSLNDKRIVSAQEFDQVSARAQGALARRDMAREEQAQAKAAVEQARTLLGYTSIRSPFDGIVTERKVDLGVMASPGMPIFTVEDVRRYRLEAAVNESDLTYIRMGQAVPVLMDALGTEREGKVVQIVPAADPGSRSFLVKIELAADPRLRSGLFGRAEFRRGEKPSLLVPRTAVVERGQLQGVFVVDQNRMAGLHYVTLGKATSDEVEVLAGLQDGDRLVATPGSLELDGKQIEARR